MKTTLAWLETHLDTEAPLAAIVECLIMLGHDVEAVEERAKGLEPFIVARVVSAERHPNADRLKLCIVDTGAEQVQVVCGAPNAHTGMKGVFAPAGTVIPRTGALLQETQIRGLASRGMLCSAWELALGEDRAGIVELPDEAPVGARYAGFLGLDDPVLDIKVTPNRADCLGVRGLARDLAAAGLGRLKPLDTSPVAGRFVSPIAIRIEDSTACPLFLGRHLRGVTNRPSPPWLARRLEAIGLRPISALVDLTNFLTYDLNRPLHVFDAGKMRGDLVVRFARPGEKLLALNGREYDLDAEMTAIADDNGVLSLGGVIGGEATGCTAATSEVFVEAALFDPVRTAATGRKLNIASDARYRFERGVDPAFVRDGLEIATRLMLELCGGEASDIVVAGAEPEWRRQYRLRAGRTEGLGGLAVPPQRSAAILAALGCTVEAALGSPRDESRGAGPAGDLAVTPPSWRGDIEGEADLVEEVLRIEGYERIPAVPLPRDSALPRPAQDPARRRAAQVRRTQAARARPRCSAAASRNCASSIRSAPISTRCGRHCCRGSSPQRARTPTAALPTRPCSSSDRPIATARRKDRYRSPPACAAAAPARANGARRRARSICSTPRPMRSPHWPPRARPPTTSRPAPSRPPGIIPAGPARCGWDPACSAPSANCIRRCSRRSICARPPPASRSSSTWRPSRAPDGRGRRSNCRCSSLSSAISPLSSIAISRPRPCCARRAASTAGSSPRSACSMSTKGRGCQRGRSRWRSRLYCSRANTP
jgi:tRNA-binding EMAP/Myf-like protein